MVKLFFFGLIVLSCSSVVVCGSDTVVQLQGFNNYQCSGAPTYATNITTGGCDSTSAQAYYPSTDNKNVLWYQFYNDDCKTSNITNIQQIPTGVCGGAGYYGGMWFIYTIFSGTNNPPAPTAFPPTSGFSTQTLYLNATDSTPSSTCDSTTRTIITAFPTPADIGSCVKNAASIGGSYQTFFSNGCTNIQVVGYSDSACQTPAIVTTAIAPFKSCDNGYKYTCVDTGAPTLPSTFTIGVTQYDNDQCTTNSMTSSTFAVPGACFEGVSYDCGMVNGTMMLTYNLRRGYNCSEAPIVSRSNVADGTPAWACVVTSDPKNVTYTCNAGPSSGPNSAVNVSVSVIVMTLAVLIGLVSGHQF